MDDLQCNCSDNRKNVTLFSHFGTEIRHSLIFLVWSQASTRNYDPDLHSCTEGSKASNRLKKDELIWHFHFQNFVEETAVNKRLENWKYIKTTISKGVLWSLQQCSHFMLLPTILRNNPIWINKINEYFCHFIFTSIVFVNWQVGSIDLWIIPSLLFCSFLPKQDIWVFHDTWSGKIRVFVDTCYLECARSLIVTN